MGEMVNPPGSEPGDFPDSNSGRAAVRVAIKLEPCYTDSMAKHKENILRLRAEGKSYRQIEKELGCAKSTVAYHCSENEKDNARKRKARIPDIPLRKKIDTWRQSGKFEVKERQKTQKTNKWRVQTKVRMFQRKDRGDTAPKLDWTYDDVREKIKDFTSCYLTGRPIDVSDPDTFQFDHMEPRSRGGDNSLDNLGVATPDANYAKGSLPLEDFLALCLDVVVHWDLVDENDVKL